MSEIAQAFDHYFEKLVHLYEKKYASKPTLYYSDSLNKALMISEIDENEEVQWLPIQQTQLLNWREIEDQLGFSVCDELKAYYTTYFFFSLNGEFGEADLYFDPISSHEGLKETILQHHSNGQDHFPHSQIFMIGAATIHFDDRFFIFYDNETSKTFCYEPESGQQILLAYSLAKVITAMEAFE